MKRSVALGKGWIAAAIIAQGMLSLSGEAQADFYRYVDKDGVEVFTNTPNNAAAVPVLREKKRKSSARKGEVLRDSDASFTASEPLLPVHGTVTSNVGWRHDPVDGGIRHHNGVDIAVPTGTSVKAIAAGTVVQSSFRGGYGNVVAVEHADGMTSLYGHNSQLLAKVGERVAAGDTIALSGSTGRSTGPHLHFELWKNGANVTEAYLQTGSGIPEVAGGIRSYLHSDGSIVFTNIR